jgi:hypothetical protein
MKNLESVKFESFKKYDYILYEQSHFRNLLSIYKEHNVKYRIIAINLFKKRDEAPIIVDLKSMNINELEDFYKNIFLSECSTGLSLFQNIGLVSNLIKSSLDLDELSEKITKLLIYNSENIIRFYDPRINIHLFNVTKYSNLDLDMKIWLKKFCSIFDEWCICVFGCYFKYIKQDSINKLIHFRIHDIDGINQNFKRNSFKNSQEIQAFFKENYKSFEVKR